MKKLNSYQLTALWNQIERKGKDLKEAAMSHDAIKVYRAVDDLEFLRRKLQNHFSALAEEEKIKEDA